MWAQRTSQWRFGCPSGPFLPVPAPFAKILVQYSLKQFMSSCPALERGNMWTEHGALAGQGSWEQTDRGKMGTKVGFYRPADLLLTRRRCPGYFVVCTLCCCHRAAVETITGVKSYSLKCPAHYWCPVHSFPFFFTVALLLAWLGCLRASNWSLGCGSTERWLKCWICKLK